MHLAGGVLALGALCDGIAAAKDAPARSTALPRGFVYLRDIDPTIAQDIRYATQRNFTGRPVPGYQAAECVLLEAAARALKQAQADLRPQGFTLKVYDCYRPTRAVRAFLAWAHAGRAAPQSERYHPHVARDRLVTGGYIAVHSAHSLGVAVDVTLVSLASPGTAAFDPDAEYGPCTAPRERREPDDSVDAGTAFDCFDPISHTGSAEITAEQRANRALLVTALAARGFANYFREWWHFRYTRAPRRMQPRDVAILPRVASAGTASTELAALARRATELADAGRYKDALQHVRALRSATERRLGKASTAFADSLVLHARVLGLLDRYPEALGAYREALAIRRRLLGPEDLPVAEALAALAAIEGARGRYGAAEELYAQAQAIREEVQGPERRDAEAEQALQRALAISRARARTRARRGDRLDNLAMLRANQGRLDEAEAADTLNRLGLVHDMMDEYDAAEASYRGVPTPFARRG